MSAISNTFEAALGPVTELEEELELVRSSGNCGTPEPRWWVVDIGVRCRVVNTSAGPVARPGASEFLRSDYSTRAPLHVRLTAGLLDGRSGSSRDWLVDATSTRAYLFGSSITAYLVGPKSLVAYQKTGASFKAKRDVFCQVSAGMWPCDTLRRPVGVPGAVARASSCSIRVHVPGDVDVEAAVPIPAGARTLMIFDSSGSSSPWTWQLGAPAVEQFGRITVVDGQSVAPALVPNFTHVTPTRLDQDRDVLLVFGMDF